MRTVQSYYDENVSDEWERLQKHPFEFRITTAMLAKHIHPGDRVLDVGGARAATRSTWQSWAAT